eukprot:TRINITY_DN9196_c0_g1_i5.p1 TRINITY_DN9196_c0_g1~~TRINITY_DN9196_c0_g1_i5.p1  ORF type:complete len:561 (+),score=92.54 TRINITY_DN9196_c0_g1_i5:58-1740(+)
MPRPMLCSYTGGSNHQAETEDKLPLGWRRKLDEFQARQEQRLLNVEEFLIKHRQGSKQDFEQLVHVFLLPVEPEVDAMKTADGLQVFQRQDEVFQHQDEQHASSPLDDDKVEAEFQQVVQLSLPEDTTERKYADDMLGKTDSILGRMLNDAHQDFRAENALNSPLSFMRYTAKKILHQSWFEYFAGLVIFLNAIVIGVETNMSVSASDPSEYSWVETAENIFLALYTLELAGKLLVEGKALFKDNWFRFDLVIVLCGWLGKFLEIAGFSSTVSWWQQILLIRMLRLLRLIRAMRTIKLFKNMWSLVYGILQSFDTMVSTFGLLLFSVFMFGCVGVDLITLDQDLASYEGTSDIVSYHFTDLFVTMLTLFQFVTCDSVAAVYMPLVLRKPLLSLYFLAALLVISISMMNLVTAVLVETALSTAAEERLTEDHVTKRKLKALLPTLLEMFQQLDTDGSGEISVEEMDQVHVNHLPKDFQNKVSADTMKELFEVLDTDGTGKLSRDEFVEGLVNIVFMQVPLPTIQMLKFIRKTLHKVDSVQDAVTKLQSTFGRERSSALPWA